MTEEVTLRKGELRDADTLAAFNVAMAWETERKHLDPEVVGRGVRAVLAQPERGFYVVAVAEGEVVGALLVTYEWSDWRCGQFWWVQSVYVQPPFRRRGIFRRLHAFVGEEASHNSQVCGLRLYVEDNNGAAQQVYTALGMRRTPYHVYEQSF
ncbi:MAG: GNAT family N-acetyltransferase [Sedimentisphaerales bacterium]|nr:GNAT family N-acetyltransferase [Sedimentisphaerales bacterium]